MAQRYTRRINLYINDKEVRNDIASIRKEMMKMQQAQNRMIVGSREYIAQGKKIALLRGVMNKHNADLRKTQQGWFSLSRAADKANKYFTAATAAAGTIVAIIMGFRSASQAAMEFEERLDNLSALTGLEGRQLEWLGKKSKETSVSITESGVRIKQSASDIVDAYTKVGSQRPELLSNKEALHEVTQNAIILSEAAKSDLMPAVKGLTMAMNQHNLGATESSRVINAMAAGSKLGAADIPYLTAAIEKSGTTLNLMNISLEENIALIEEVSPSYSQASEAGNSLDKTFLMMKAQGIGFKDGVFDISRALGELKTRFENGESAVDLFGLRHAKMASILVKNRHEFTRFRDGVTDTSIAFEQAGKNTDNNAAKLAQAQNRMKLAMIQFGETINPVFLKSTNLVTYLIKGLVKLPQFIRDNQMVLIALAGAVLAYNGALIKVIGSQLIKFTQDKLELFYNGALVSVATLRVAAMKIQILFLRKQTAAQMAHVQSLKKGILYQQLFGKALMANPIGIAIAAIFALVLAIKAYDKYSKQAKQRAEEKATAQKNLTAANESLKASYDELNKDVNRLNRLSVKEKTNLQEKINKTIALAEAELTLHEAKQLEIQKNNSQSTAWQKTLNILKSGGNAYIGAALNVADAAKNGIDAASEMTDGIETLREKISQLKQTDNSLYELLNAEKIGDEIGTSTLVEMEEKLMQYQTALKNVIVGSEDYLRVQEKIKVLEKTISDARAANAAISEDELKKRVANLEAIHNATIAAIKKRHLEGEISEDQYNANLLKQELIFLQSKLSVYKTGSLEYQKAFNESLTLQVKADRKIKDLLLKAEQELAGAKINNLHDGLIKEQQLENQRWKEEKAKLEQQLVDKKELSEKELLLNETINQTIQEKEIAHQQKLKEIEDAANLTNLENLVTAAKPVDETNTELAELQSFYDARQTLIDAQYAREIALAGNNQAALLAAEKKYQRKSLEIKNAQIDAEFALNESKINSAQMYISALQGIVNEESALGKALFLFNQGLAIADVWMNIAKANAKAVAASPLTFGQPWVGANTMQGALQTGIILAQTVKEFATGKYPVQGESGKTYNTTYAGRPHTGMYDGPQLGIFNEIPGQPEMVVDGITTRQIQVNYPQILKAIYDISAGRVPQFAEGKYPSNIPDFNIATNTLDANQYREREEETNKILQDLTREIKALREYRPSVAVETIERASKDFLKIKQTSGL